MGESSHLRVEGHVKQCESSIGARGVVRACLLGMALGFTLPAAAGERGGTEDEAGMGTPTGASDRVEESGLDQIRLFGGLSMAVTDPLQTSSNAAGFGFGVQRELGPWFAVWGLVSYQTEDETTDWVDEGYGGLQYSLGSFGAKVGFTARANLRHVMGPPRDALMAVLEALEFGIGPVAGLAWYRQEVRGENERSVLVPTFGLLLEMDIWFTQWLALRFAGDFGWSLANPLVGDRSVMRGEVFLGPSVRF